MAINLKKLKFPIGEYVPTKNPTSDELRNWVSEIEEFPYDD